MPINFACSNCQRTIRVPDGTEGRKTKCPRCEHVQQIPETSEVALAADDPPADISWEGAAASQATPANDLGPSNPFGDAPAVANPYASPPTTDPYGPPSGKPVSRESARQSLMGPAIALIVICIVGIVTHVSMFVYQGFQMEQHMPPMDDPAQRIGFYIGFFGAPAILSILALTTIAAMARALKVRNYGFVMTGFILGLIPCTTCYCYLLALPFAIWGIVVLCDSSVQAAFRLP